MASPLLSADLLPSPEWITAVGMWLTALRAAGRPYSTLRLRRCQLARLARDLAPAGPWEVSGFDLVQWIGSQSWATETMASHRAAARTFYAWCFGAGLTDHNPALALPAVRGSEPNPQPAPEIVYREGLARADARVELMILLAAGLGMRRAEVACASSEDVERDLDGFSMVVHGKGGKVRMVPLPGDLELRIRAYVRENGPGWLFPSRYGGHLSADWVGRLVAEVLPGAWTMHKLRHRFATALHCEVGGDLLVVQEALGHATVETTRRYVRVSSAKLRAGVEAVGRL